MAFKKGNKIWKLRKKEMFGENNPNWSGNKVGYSGVHRWVKMNKHKPEYCEDCWLKKPLDLTNISGEYKRDINDYEWLCRKCHMKKDGRYEKAIDNLKNAKKLKGTNGKYCTKPVCQICGESMVNDIDSITRKVSPYLWKTTCGHAKNLRLSIG